MLELARSLVTEFEIRQRSDLHFRDLADFRKQRLCEALAAGPGRAIVVMSNKKNMEGHTNPRAAKVGGRNIFYCWMMRLLLERVTNFCRDDALRHNRTLGKVRIVFSKSTGVSYPQMKAYFEWLRNQSRNDNLWLKQGDLAWDVYDRTLVFIEEHRRSAGLQLSDGLASAFYQAVETIPEKPLRPGPAMALKPILARRNGRCWSLGLKLMPSLQKAILTGEQRRFLDHFRM